MARIATPTEAPYYGTGPAAGLQNLDLAGAVSDYVATARQKKQDAMTQRLNESRLKNEENERNIQSMLAPIQRIKEAHAAGVDIAGGDYETKLTPDVSQLGTPQGADLRFSGGGDGSTPGPLQSRTPPNLGAPPPTASTQYVPEHLIPYQTPRERIEQSREGADDATIQALAPALESHLNLTPGTLSKAHVSARTLSPVLQALSPKSSDASTLNARLDDIHAEIMEKQNQLLDENDQDKAQALKDQIEQLDQERHSLRGDRTGGAGDNLPSLDQLRLRSIAKRMRKQNPNASDQEIATLTRNFDQHAARGRTSTGH